MTEASPYHRADLLLLGHTHIVILLRRSLGRIFYPGTPEPDGFDCDHQEQHGYWKWMTRKSRLWFRGIYSFYYKDPRSQ
jgi:hypothetical protein